MNARSLPMWNILKFEGSDPRETFQVPMSAYANKPTQFSCKPAGGAAAYLITLEGAKKALMEQDVMSA